MKTSTNFTVNSLKSATKTIKIKKIQTCLNLALLKKEFPINSIYLSKKPLIIFYHRTKQEQANIYPKENASFFIYFKSNGQKR